MPNQEPTMGLLPCPSRTFLQSEKWSYGINFCQIPDPVKNMKYSGHIDTDIDTGSVDGKWWE